MKITKKNIKDLIPYANNARTHSSDQIAKIASSIKEFGFNNPVLIDKNNGVIAGHGRIEAAKLLGLKEVPTIALEHLNKTQRKAYMLADNRMALDAGWEHELLKLEINALHDEGFDLKLTGFDDKELKELLNNDPIIELDEKEEEYKAKFEVVVECEDEADQEAIYKLMTSKGYKCRPLSM